MKSLIALTFDKNYAYFMINLVSFIVIYRYEVMWRKRYIYESANLISILVSLICMIIKKNAIIIEKNSNLNIETDLK